MKMQRLFLLLMLLAGGAIAADYAKDEIVVSQGGAEIKFGEVDALVRRLPAEERAKSMDNPVRIENTLSSMLLVRQLANQAREMGLDKDPDVQAEIAWTVEEKLATARSEQFVRDLKIPNLEELAKERYNADKAAYAVPERRSARHLLVAIKPGRNADEAKEIADKLYQEAAANPENFQSLIMSQSDDASKEQNHGLIDDALSPDLDNAFVQGVKALTHEGEISKPIKSSFGWHIIKLERLQHSRPRSYAEVHDELLASLQKAYVNQKKREFIDEIRNMKIEAEPDRVASLRTRYANDAAQTVQGAATESRNGKKEP